MHCKKSELAHGFYLSNLIFKYAFFFFFNSKSYSGRAPLITKLDLSDYIYVLLVCPVLFSLLSNKDETHKNLGQMSVFLNQEKFRSPCKGILLIQRLNIWILSKECL